MIDNPNSHQGDVPGQFIRDHRLYVRETKQGKSQLDGLVQIHDRLTREHMTLHT